jgi:hypothetical protein
MMVLPLEQIMQRSNIRNNALGSANNQPTSSDIDEIANRVIQELSSRQTINTRGGR